METPASRPCKRTEAPMTNSTSRVLLNSCFTIHPSIPLPSLHSYITLTNNQILNSLTLNPPYYDPNSKLANNQAMAKNLAALMMIIVLMTGMLESSRAVTICNMKGYGQDACMPSVKKSNPVDPSPACCDALKGADLNCFCSYKDSFMLPILGIDSKQAMATPPKCGLTNPPDCQGVY